MDKSMNKRIVPSIILSLLTIFCLFYYPLCGVFVTLLIVVGLYEFFYMVEKKGVRMFKPLGLLIGALIPLTIYFGFSASEGWQFLFVIIALFILFLLELRGRSRRLFHQLGRRVIFFSFYRKH